VPLLGRLFLIVFFASSSYHVTLGVIKKETKLVPELQMKQESDILATESDFRSLAFFFLLSALNKLEINDSFRILGTLSNLKGRHDKKINLSFWPLRAKQATINNIHWQVSNLMVHRDFIKHYRYL